MFHSADLLFCSRFLSDLDDRRCCGCVPKLKSLLDKEDLEYWYMITRNIELKLSEIHSRIETAHVQIQGRLTS